MLALAARAAEFPSQSTLNRMTANEQSSMEVDQPIVQDSSKTEPYTPGQTAVDLTPDKDGGVLKEIKQAGTSDETPSLALLSTIQAH